MNTDITGVRFSDKARWGEKKVKESKYRYFNSKMSYKLCWF
jgi:hypothetical protein